MNLKNLSIKRLTVHKVYGKAGDSDPYAEDCTEFCKLGADGNEILHERILSALGNKKKFFELDLHDESPESFFNLQRPLWGAKSKEFIRIANLIADKSAASQTRRNVPDGLLLVIEATIDSKNTVITVKAEKSDAFSMSGNDLTLIKDLFLSSDKTLYKLGFFVKVDDKNSTKRSYRYFVYDDSFTPAKEDLAVYFYSAFLGLSTGANSKLQTNNLHKTLVNFANSHISFLDRMELLRTIDRIFMDTNVKTINADKFKSVFPEEVLSLFDKEVGTQFPHGIVKDLSIVNTLDTKRISLTPSTTLLLKANPEGLYIGDTTKAPDKKKLRTVLDSGKKYNFVIIPGALEETE